MVGKIVSERSVGTFVVVVVAEVVGLWAVRAIEWGICCWRLTAVGIDIEVGPVSNGSQYVAYTIRAPRQVDFPLYSKRMEWIR